jgi:hypothetical protein
MDAFSYLSVLISIVLGLGVTHLLASAAKLIRFRAAVRLYAPTLVWIGLLFLLHVQIWWAVFELRDVSDWTFFSFLLVLAIPTLAYLLSALLVPDFDRETDIDLKASYFENRRWFFGLFTLIPLVSLVQEAVISSGIRWDADPVFRLGFLVLGLVGVSTRRERVHQWLAPVGFIAFAGYITFLFLRLS